MISGTVSTFLEAIVTVRLIDVRREVHEIEAVVDTGFSGWLTLPASLIEAFGFPWQRVGQDELADGSKANFDIHEGIVEWEGQHRLIPIDCADTDPLVGMALMQGCELRVQVDDGGVVELTGMI